MKVLRFASLMADNAAPFCRGLSAYLGAELVEDVPWRDAERLLLLGEAHVGIVCGLQYVLHADVLDVLAAPVMSLPRYGGRPVYFSDVVVRGSSAVGGLADLRGCVWAVNEPTSHSGYNLIRSTLASRGLAGDFFGRVVFSGAHERSLQMLRDGVIDASAVDSTVLEQALLLDPGLPSVIRVVETLGPSPIPPLVVSRALAASQLRALTDAVLAMHADPIGQTVLAAGHMSRFVPVTDADYEPIRAMGRLADTLAPWPHQLKNEISTVR